MSMTRWNKNYHCAILTEHNVRNEFFVLERQGLLKGLFKFLLNVVYERTFLYNYLITYHYYTIFGAKNDFILERNLKRLASRILSETNIKKFCILSFSQDVI